MSKPAYKVGKLPRHICLYFLWSFYDLIHIKLTKWIIVLCWQQKIFGCISKSLSTWIDRKLLFKREKLTKKHLSSRFMTNFTLKSLIATALHEMGTMIKLYFVFFVKLMHLHKFLFELVAIWWQNSMLHIILLYCTSFSSNYCIP